MYVTEFSSFYVSMCLYQTLFLIVLGLISTYLYMIFIKIFTLYCIGCGIVAVVIMVAVVSIVTVVSIVAVVNKVTVVWEAFNFLWRPNHNTHHISPG